MDSSVGQFGACVKDRNAVRLVLASTCSDRKAAVASGQVALRSVPPLSAGERARQWAKQLQLAATATTQADRLYLGPHWSASKRALDAACEAGLAAKMYVVSAGYGLYPVDALVTSYAATFSPGHRDTVPPGNLDAEDRRNYLAAWWKSVAKHVRLPGVKIRTFAQMAAADPDQRILVVAGGHYLDAISQDLAESRPLLHDPDFLAVISAGASESAARTLAFAPHSKPLDWQCDELSELVERAARELRSRFGDVDYVAVSAGGLGLPSPDDYALLCFVTEEGRWLGVDAVSVFSLGASGAAAISALCTGNPWREHLGVVGEQWR